MKMPIVQFCIHVRTPEIIAWIRLLQINPVRSCVDLDRTTNTRVHYIIKLRPSGRQELVISTPLVGKSGVVLYSIVSCSHVRLRNCKELCRNMSSHVRIECESLIKYVSSRGPPHTCAR